MKEQSAAGNQSSQLQPYLSPMAVWALSVGSAIGWGSLVVTGSTYLAQAGPMGSVLGLLVGMALMLMVAYNYHCLANRYPGTGGLYNYVKYIFGYDRAFLVAWFMFLVYIAIFWANATSIPLFARYFLQSVFSFGYLYTIFGYDVYLGEVVITIAVMAAVGLLCIKSKRITATSMVVMALVFTIGISICFAVVMAGHHQAGISMDPAFIPDVSAVRQVMLIAFISPWAFIGFESVTHSAAEYRFEHKNIFRVLVISLAVTTALYIFVILLSVSAYPEGCSSWLDYISRLNEFEGIAGLPAFYAANHYMGPAGVYILMAALLALVLTSLIGMLRTLSRLCYAVAQDGILPNRFSKLNDKQIPVNAILLVLGISVFIPFLGRTPIGWIVDTTTIGATILYGFAALAVFKVARQEKLKAGLLTGGISAVFFGVFLVVMVLPEIFSGVALETETYVLLAVWSLLGLIFFNWVIQKDHARNFGKAIIVWIALLAFIVLMSMTLADRMNATRENAVMDDVQYYMTHQKEDRNLAGVSPEEFINVQRVRLLAADNGSFLLILGLFSISFVVLIINYRTMQKWELKAAAERDHANTIANTDPLTGVKSKHAFAVEEGRMETQIVDGEAEDFAVVVCDVNGLKHINDTLGHKAGDEYIRSACHLLCDFYTHSPVFRVGGDEFVVVLKGRDFEDRDTIFKDINARIEQNLKDGKVVISVGMSDYDQAADASFHEVFKRADQLMYTRKMELKAMGAVTRE